MAFIVLKRSRNTRNYYLVESYRDRENVVRKRTLCYLGRESDGTDTLDKAFAHWKLARDDLKRALRSAKGDPKEVLRRRLAATDERIAIIGVHLDRENKRLAAAQAERHRREQLAEEQKHWQAIERLRSHPSDENAAAAKKAFLQLAKRHHPDQGGRHQDFLRLKDAYDRARVAWRRVA